jgi:hypothetical protein
MKVTMTLGEFREATKDLPNDTEIFVNDGDFRYQGVHIASHLTLAPVLGHPWVVTLDLGQVWNEERDIDSRIDGALGNY